MAQDLGPDGPRFLGELDKLVDDGTDQTVAEQGARDRGTQYGKAYPSEQARAMREHLRALSARLRSPRIGTPTVVRRDIRQKAVIDAALEGLGPEREFRNQVDVQPPRA
jgi:hypothetical protein